MTKKIRNYFLSFFLLGLGIFVGTVLHGCAPVDDNEELVGETNGTVDVKETTQPLYLGGKTFYPSSSSTRIPFAGTWYSSDITIGVGGSNTVNEYYPPYNVPLSQCTNPNSSLYYRYKITPTDTNPATLDHNVQWSWDLNWSSWPATLEREALRVHLCRVMAPYGATSQVISDPYQSGDCIDVSTQKTGGTTRWNNVQFDKVIGHPHFVLVFAVAGHGSGQMTPVPTFNLSLTFVKMFVTRIGSASCAY